MPVKKVRRTLTSVAALAALMMVAVAQAEAPKQWTTETLMKALSDPSRPQADRDRDANRKPAQLMMYFGVKPGMTVLDVEAGGGYLTEVLSITVGPSGKVYMQNPTKSAGKHQERTANNRLPNVIVADGDFPNPIVPSNSVDFAITAMNIHIANNTGGPEGARQFLKGAFDSLKPGGVLAVSDHNGSAHIENKGLHRMPKQVALDAAKAAGFVFDGESNLLANPADNHTLSMKDMPRGTTDQFLFRFKKPK